MTSPTAPTLQRVRLVNNEYMMQHGGRLKAGTAVEVDAQTAERWLKNGIAEPAEIGDQTLREQKLALIEQLQREAEELSASVGVFDQGVTRDGQPLPPVGRGRRGAAE